MEIKKLMTGILLFTVVEAHSNVAHATAAQPSSNASVVMVPSGSISPPSMTIKPSGQLFGCQSGPVASVHTKMDSGFTAVLLGGKAIVGHQNFTASIEDVLAETVFIECGKEIHRVVVTSQADPVVAKKQEKVPPAPEQAGEITLIPSATVIQEAQEALAKEKDAEGEGCYSVPISASDLNMFTCDGAGPVSLRLAAIPYVDTGTVIPSDTNPEVVYFKVNEAAFDGNGEYQSAHNLWVSCGGIETKLHVYPGKLPGQVVVIK